MKKSFFDPGEKRELLKKILQEREPVPVPLPQISGEGQKGMLRHLKDGPEIREWSERMATLLSQGFKDPCFRVLEGPAAGTALINGRQVLDFSGYNYLGLAADPRVTEAAKVAIDRYGTSASASRLASGERPLHSELEKHLAEFLGVEEALVFSAGYGTNVAVIGHLLGPRDLILHDELAHNSIITGCHLARSKRLSFRHNDLGAVDELLSRHRGTSAKALIAIEGAYSMDGDYPDLPEMIGLARKHGASLFVDEAHSLGVMGATGRGIGEHFGVDRGEIELWMGTLSKSLSSVGGYVAGCRELIRYLRYTVPGFIFSAGLPPASAAAALMSLQLMRQESWRIEKLRENVDLFLGLAKAAGLDTGHSRDTAVVPVILHDSRQCLKAAAELFEDAINVFPMTYPAVADNEARLRFFISASHTPEQIHSAIPRIALRAGRF